MSGSETSEGVAKGKVFLPEQLSNQGLPSQRLLRYPLSHHFTLLVQCLHIAH